MMLISLMAFCMYLENESAGIGDVFGRDRVGATVGVLLFNMVMLVFGLLVELERTPYPNACLALGGVSFVASFGILYTQYVAPTDDIVALLLFVFTYVVWGMYGVAATQPYVRKNVAYNILDIFSKNTYGVFLFVYALAVM